MVKAVVLTLTGLALLAFVLSLLFLVTPVHAQQPGMAPSGPQWNSWIQVVPQQDGSMVTVPRNLYRDPYTGQTQVMPTPQQTYQEPRPRVIYRQPARPQPQRRSGGIVPSLGQRY